MWIEVVELIWIVIETKWLGLNLTGGFVSNINKYTVKWWVRVIITNITRKEQRRYKNKLYIVSWLSYCQISARQCTWMFFIYSNNWYRFIMSGGCIFFFQLMKKSNIKNKTSTSRLYQSNRSLANNNWLGLCECG